MMRHIFDFITKANQFLFFLGALGIAGAIAYSIYDRPSYGYHAPSVKIATTPEEKRDVVVDDVEYLGVIGEYYLLGIVKKGVELTPIDEPVDATRETVWQSGFSRRARDAGAIVNVIFSKGGRKVRALLDRDGLVISHRGAPIYHEDDEGCVVFLCIIEDTTGDSRLDLDDRQDLIVVTRDVEKPNIVVRSIVDHTVISSSRIVAKILDDSGFRFVEIDAATRTISDVAWN